MAVTLITILAINAALQNGESVPAFYITLPAAVVTFCRDLYSGWRNRHESRTIARRGREAVERARVQNRSHLSHQAKGPDPLARTNPTAEAPEAIAYLDNNLDHAQNESGPQSETTAPVSEKAPATDPTQQHLNHSISEPDTSPVTLSGTTSSQEIGEKGEAAPTVESKKIDNQHDPTTLMSIISEQWAWCRETFPTVTTVLRTLPYPLVPFALCMFVLVQALGSKGWVAVFAYGWSHWIEKTGTIGAIGGMAFLSIILCNFAGTNIGTAILLCRVVQAWVEIHKLNQDPISQRTFWATVYSLTIGLNYGAFSTFFSASLAGLLWRDILKRKRIIVKEWDFARVNSSIIAFTTVIACVVLIGEVYITRNTKPYQESG